MKNRNERQNAIREIIRNAQIRTQRELAAALKERGFACTQATVSRDIADMGLSKLPEGSYALAEDLYLQKMVSELVTAVEPAINLVVIKTEAGAANGVASALDAAALMEVVGTLAGDDTILVVTKDEARAQDLVNLINGLRNAG